MRITVKDLRSVCERLNRATRALSNGPNSFHLDICNGGYRLARRCEEGSGESDESPRVSARELYDIMQGMLKGMEYAIPYKYDSYRTTELNKAEMYSGTCNIKISGCKEITISESELNKIRAILGAI